MCLPVYSNHNSHEMKQKHRIRADSALPNKRVLCFSAVLLPFTRT